MEVRQIDILLYQTTIPLSTAGL